MQEEEVAAEPCGTGRKALGCRGGKCPGPGLAGGSGDPGTSSPRILTALYLNCCSS